MIVPLGRAAAHGPCNDARPGGSFNGHRTRRTADRAAHRRRGAPARGVPAWVRRRRQRPHRHRPCLAAGHAARRIRVAARAQSMWSGWSRARVVSFDGSSASRTMARSDDLRARAQPVPRRRACAPQLAAVGAGAGRLQPGHHDGAACRLAPRGRAARHRRLFRPAGGAAGRQAGDDCRGDQVAPARSC